MLTLICSELIFRRLLVKPAEECTFKFNDRFLKELGGVNYGQFTICYIQ